MGGRKDPDERRAYSRAYYERNRERILEQKATARQANPEQARARDKRANDKRKHTPEYREYLEASRDQARARGREWRKRQRIAALGAYGGRCACCGEDYEPYLELDHIDGGGFAHRRSLTRTLDLVLREQGYPEGYQVLCANCHTAKTKGVPCRHGARPCLSSSTG